MGNLESLHSARRGSLGLIAAYDGINRLGRQLLYDTREIHDCDEKLGAVSAARDLVQAYYRSLPLEEMGSVSGRRSIAATYRNVIRRLRTLERYIKDGKPEEARAALFHGCGRRDWPPSLTTHLSLLRDKGAALLNLYDNSLSGQEYDHAMSRGTRVTVRKCDGKVSERGFVEMRIARMRSAGLV